MDNKLKKIFSLKDNTSNYKLREKGEKMTKEQHRKNIKINLKKQIKKIK